jgi:hypothetical protein
VAFSASYRLGNGPARLDDSALPCAIGTRHLSTIASAQFDGFEAGPLSFRSIRIESPPSDGRPEGTS